MVQPATSGRTRVRRLPERQQTDRAAIEAALDEAIMAHVGVVRDGWPVVLPFACARDGDHLLLHGSTGAGVLRGLQQGVPVCVTVTHLDALVVARSAFDNSMNYRCVVAYGVPEVLSGEAQGRALEVLTDHLLPGRVAEVRASTPRELAATLVLRLPLDEVSLKVRTGPPTPAPGEDPSVWAGVVPLTIAAGPPLPAPDVPPAAPPPASVRAVLAARPPSAERRPVSRRSATTCPTPGPAPTSGRSGPPPSGRPAR